MSAASTVVPEVQADAVLLARVRGGDGEAYAILFDRHRSSAMSFARRLAGPNHADDLVAEAFTKVLDALRRDLGPTVSFRAYLLTSIRSLWANTLRGASRLELVEDYDALTDAGSALAISEDADARYDRGAVAAAYRSLPERWRAVLWFTAVEGLPHAEIAEHLGIKSNAVAALSFRAREGLRQAYLSQHLATVDDTLCRAMAPLLPAYARGHLDKRKRRPLEAHLDGCLGCTAALADLEDVNHRLGVLLLPVVLGVGAHSIGWPALGEPARATHTTVAATAAKAGLLVLGSAVAALAAVGAPLLLLSSDTGVAIDSTSTRQPTSAVSDPTSTRVVVDPPLSGGPPSRTVTPSTGNPPASSTAPPVGADQAPQIASPPEVRETGAPHSTPPITLPSFTPDVSDIPTTVPTTTPPPTEVPPALSPDGAITTIEVAGTTVLDQSAARISVQLTNLHQGSTLDIVITSATHGQTLQFNRDWGCTRSTSQNADGTSTDVRLSCTYQAADASTAELRLVAVTSGTATVSALLTPPSDVIDPDPSNNTATTAIAP